MKQLIFYIGFVILALFCSCGKSVDPSPGITNKPNTGTDQPAVVSYSYTRNKDILTAGGNFSINDDGTLNSIDCGDANISSKFLTASGVNTNTKTSLENAKNMVFELFSGVWRSNTTNYNASDTLTMPYIRAIYTDETNKKIVETRAYIVGNMAHVYWYASKQPNVMNLDLFTNMAKTQNTQKVAVAAAGN